MKSIGVFICNYNKKDYIVSCVKSITSQSFQDFDLYVIDNASTDGSVSALRKEYGDKINIVVNQKNLGGSGGFNTGLRIGIEAGYKYSMLVDNDVIMDKDAIKELYEMMEKYTDIGLGGSKILQMQKPEYLQDFGGRISFQSYSANGINCDEMDCDKFSGINYCDYVSACSLIVRAEVINKIGLMNEDDFIYWDDMEWGYLCNKSGNKVAACGRSKVWHNHTIKNPVNTFVRYYFHRNRLNFFAKYIEECGIDSFIEHSLRNLFNMMYGDFFKNTISELQSTMYALDDMIHGINGEADQGRIVPIEYGNDPFSILVKSISKILIIAEDTEVNHRRADKITQKIMSIHAEAEIVVSFIENVPEKQRSKYDAVFKICNHANLVKENILPLIYIDEWYNCITSQRDYEYFSNFDNSLDLFLKMYGPLFKEGVRKIRCKMN